MEAFKAGAFGLVISVGSEEFPVSCAEGRLYDIEKLGDLLLRIFLDRLIAFLIFSTGIVAVIVLGNIWHDQSKFISQKFEKSHRFIELMR